MANAKKDENEVSSLIGASSTDGVTPTVVYVNPSTHRVLVDLPGGSTGFQQPTSGTVNGVNKTFTWTTAPNAIVVDNGRVIQATSSDGTQNWAGTTTTVLAIAPNNDIFSVA